jgi:hypothetical protein
MPWPPSQPPATFITSYDASGNGGAYTAFGMLLANGTAATVNGFITLGLTLVPPPGGEQMGPGPTA